MPGLLERRRLYLDNRSDGYTCWESFVDAFLRRHITSGAELGEAVGRHLIGSAVARSNARRHTG